MNPSVKTRINVKGSVFRDKGLVFRFSCCLDTKVQKRVELVKWPRWDRYQHPTSGCRDTLRSDLTLPAGMGRVTQMNQITCCRSCMAIIVPICVYI